MIEGDDIIYPPGNIEKLSYIAETFTAAKLSINIVTDLIRKHAVSKKVEQVIRNLRELLYKFQNLLLTESLLKNLLPRINDQNDYNSKLLVKFQHDTTNPFAMNINSDYLIDEIKKDIDVLIKDSNSDLKQKLTQVQGIKLRYPFLYDGSSPLFKWNSTEKKYTCRIRKFLRNYIQFETEKALCQAVYDKTGIRVNTLKEINKVAEAVEPEFRMPEICNNFTTDHYVMAPFINFKRKEESNQQIFRFVFCHADIVKHTNFLNIYEESQLILSPEVNEKFAVITEIIVYTYLNSAIISSIKTDSPDMKKSLTDLRHVNTAIQKLLLDKTILRSYLPRIVDQKDDFDKLLAKIRQDLTNPWALNIRYELLNLDIKQKLGILGFKSTIHRQFFLREDTRNFMSNFLIDGSAPIFSTKNVENYHTNPMMLFLKYIQHETEALIYKTVLEKTGVTVASLKDLHEKFIIDPEHEIPDAKLKITSKSLYAKVPFYNFKKK